MGNGWIKLHRKLLESLAFGNEKALKIWIWCLLKANHSPNTFLLGRSKISLQAGQFVMGSEKAVDELRIAKATIWYWLNFLEKEGQVRLQKYAKYTVVTIPKWSEYQVDLDAGKTLAERWVGTNKNEKNVNNTIGELKTRVEVISETEDKPQKEKKDTSYLKVFELWEGYPLNWKANRTEIAAAKNLLIETDLEQMGKMLKIYNKFKGVDMCPQILKPSDLDRKWENLLLFRKKHS